eukprot:TRINITY_DN103163_c0_g1_i1.p1 TRINITY_DN103163_c0_g1~~TRINITY_DN103163_c0_g1_i1.p1  ORF type:complete len:257 (+),score=47.07 TRINITY_DN103163_c0_g1_i1:27-797(+)
MVDYSKWDNLEVSSSEDEEPNPPPRVTKLTPGSSITIGNSGPTIQSAAKSSECPQPVKKETVQSSTFEWPSSWYKNGVHWTSMAWCQNLEEAVVSVIVPAKTRAKEISPTFQPKHLTVMIKGAPDALLDKELQYNIEVDEDTLDGCWELLDLPSDPSGRRVVRLTLKKGLVATGLAGHIKGLWWDRLFEGDEKIDTSKFEERQNKAKVQQQWQESWAEAHKMFKEKIAQGGIKPPFDLQQAMGDAQASKDDPVEQD